MFEYLAEEAIKQQHAAAAEESEIGQKQHVKLSSRTANAFRPAAHMTSAVPVTEESEKKNKATEGQNVVLTEVSMEALLLKWSNGTFVYSISMY